MTIAAPSSDLDLFDDATLLDPTTAWAELREAGPAVHLTRHDLWFLGRHAEAREALRDAETFSSAAGIGLNDDWNHAWDAALINLDAPDHTAQRRLFTDRLSAGALKPLADTIDSRARALADALVARDRFDAVTDLAQDLPINAIIDLIGWPAEGRDELLSMASAWFDAGGPGNARAARAAPTVDALVGYLGSVVAERDVAEGGFAATMIAAHDRGEIPVEAAVGLLAGYVVAAFDTTISAIASGVWLFARHPDQWAALRENPRRRIVVAISEIVRLETPIQYFTRVATREVEIGQDDDRVRVPAGARVLIGYGAGNRDGRRFPDPDTFDITRSNADHLAFGAGVHTCAGQSLARLEAGAVFAALAERVSSFELLDEPVRAINNLTRGLASVPVRAHGDPEMAP